MDPLDATTMRAPTRSRDDDADATTTLTVAWHADPSRVGDVASFDRSVKLSRLEPEFRGRGADRPLGDPNISRRPIDITVTSGGGARVHIPDGGSRVVVDGAEVDGDRSIDAAELERGVVIEIGERVVLVLRRVTGRRGGGEPYGMVGGSRAIGWIVEQVERVAPKSVHVLLRGATGTGKELVASAIHRSSERSAGNFVAVNMTTLPPATATSQLFGHQKGAFTGAATDHDGFFAAADGGTLFLDEIGETPDGVQPMLLRTLETGEVVPVGATTARKLDVRIVAATDADLEKAVSEDKFRSPLLHRLAGYQIELPTLAERREDIGPLLVHFLAGELELATRDPKSPLWLSSEQVGRLIMHPWPGNVRQLRNAARRLAIACGDSEVVSERELARAIDAAPPEAPDPKGEATGKERKRPEDISDDDLVAALRASKWKTSAAASALGISRTSLYALIEKCDRVRKARDIDAAEIERAIAESKTTAAAAAALEVSERGLKLRMKELGISG